jgi:hypothetical protein
MELNFMYHDVSSVFNCIKQSHIGAVHVLDIFAIRSNVYISSQAPLKAAKPQNNAILEPPANGDINENDIAQKQQNIIRVA